MKMFTKSCMAESKFWTWSRSCPLRGVKVWSRTWSGARFWSSGISFRSVASESGARTWSGYPS